MWTAATNVRVDIAQHSMSSETRTEVWVGTESVPGFARAAQAVGSWNVIEDAARDSTSDI